MNTIPQQAIPSLIPIQFVDGQTGEIVTFYRSSTPKHNPTPPATPETITRHLAEHGDIVSLTPDGGAFFLVEISPEWQDFLAAFGSSNEDLEQELSK